ncbi:MAG: SLBB domain-containing protein [Chthonomonadales bacterium]
MSKSNLWFILAILLATFVSPQASADVHRLDPLAKPGTRLGPDYEVSIDIAINGIDEKDLCRIYLLDREGRVHIKLAENVTEPIPLLGKTAAEGRPIIAATMRKYFLSVPEVRVGITRIPRFRIFVWGSTWNGGEIILGDGAHLSDALLITSYLPEADLHRVKLQRKERDGRYTQRFVDFQKAVEGSLAPEVDPIMQEGDVVTIDTRPKATEAQTFAVEGEVKKPGFYPFKKGITVRQGLLEAFGLTPDADPDKVTIVRSKGAQFLSVDAVKAMRAVATDDLELMPDDVVVVATRDQAKKISILGQVASPLSVPLKPGLTLKQAISDAGGFRPDADRKSLLLMRNMLQDPTRSTPVQIDFDRIARGEMPDVPLQAGDVVQVLPRRKQQSPFIGIGMMILRHFLPIPF